jgi:hypothetical protein
MGLAVARSCEPPSVAWPCENWFGFESRTWERQLACHLPSCRNKRALNDVVRIATTRRVIPTCAYSRSLATNHVYDDLGSELSMGIGAPHGWRVHVTCSGVRSRSHCPITDSHTGVLSSLFMTSSSRFTSPKPITRRQLPRVGTCECEGEAACVTTQAAVPLSSCSRGSRAGL